MEKPGTRRRKNKAIVVHNRSLGCGGVEGWRGDGVQGMRRVCVCISTDRKVSCQYYVPFSVDTERYVGALVDTSTLLSQNVGSPSKNVAFGLLTHLNPFFFFSSWQKSDLVSPAVQLPVKNIAEKVQSEEISEP